MLHRFTTSFLPLSQIRRLYSSQIDPRKKTSFDIKTEIYNIFNHKIPLETSKIKNTFGLKLIDLLVQYKNLKFAFAKTHTPIVIKALLISELSIYVYNKYIRKHLMLSKHYKDSFKSYEQKLIKSPYIKFLTKDTLPQLAFDSLIYYFIGKSLYVANPLFFYKTFAIGLLGSISAYNINKYSQRFFKAKYNMNNVELYPNKFNLIPNMLVATTCFNLFDLVMPYQTKYILGSIPIDKKFFFGYFYFAILGRISKFVSLFTSPSLNLASSEGVTAIALSSIIGNRKGYLMPFILTHYLNPYALWIFVKTKNNMYQDELDKIYSKKKFGQKIKTLLRFTTLNSLSFMLDI